MKTADEQSARLEPTSEVLSALERYLQMLEAGAAPAAEEFVAQHPGLEGPLRSCLASLDFLHGAAGGFRAPAPAPEGRTLGDFRIIRELGRGGMGVVYEAEQLSLGRRVALKVLPFAGTLDQRQLQRFRHEAQIAACLHHPHIVPVYAVGSERAVHFFAMQLVEGQSLADLIRQLRRERGLDPAGAGDTAARADTAPTPLSRAGGRPYFESVARLIAHAADALEHAHSLGVVHRDIKPGNLLLGHGGHLWVTDFGLAQAQADPRLTLSGDIVGTLRYMPPEQAQGGALPADPRGDVYGLGVTLYELVTLRPAFEADGRRELLRQVAQDDPTPPRRIDPDVPAELETILLKAMAKAPHERYPGAGELRDDLESWLADRPIRARRPTLWQRAARLMRRHQGVAVTAAAACLLLLAGLAGWAWREALLADGRARDSEARRAEVQGALGREEEQRRKAEGRTALTLELLDRMYLRLAEDHLPRSPAALEEERGFIADALAAYARLQEEGGGPEVRREAAIAQCRVGCLQMWLGLDEEASVNLREARGRLEALPAEGRVRSALVACLTRLGDGQQHRGEPAAAETLYRQAMTLAEGAARVRVVTGLASALERQGRPGDAERLLADTRRGLSGRMPQAALAYQLASVRAKTEGPEAALALLAEAVTLCREQLAETPGDVSMRRLLVKALGSVGGLRVLRGEMAAAERAHSDAAIEAATLAQSWPGVADYRRLLALVMGDKGRLLATRGDTSAPAVLRAAAAQARELVAQGEWAVKTWPGTRAHRAALAEDAGLAAALLLMGGNDNEALARCRQCVAEYDALCKQAPDYVEWKEELAGGRFNLALCLARKGRTNEALKEMEASRDAWLALPANPGRRAHIARAWMQLGVIRRKASDDKGAEKAYREAVPLYRALAEAPGCPAQVRGEHGQACNNLANILFARREDAEAGRLYEEAGRAGEWMAEHCPADAGCRTLRLYPALMRARVIARAGGYAEAYQAIASLPARVPDIAEANFRAADFLMAVRADLLSSDAGPSLKRGLARRIDETAVRLLSAGPLPPRALEMGSFRPLRGHPTFKGLMRPASR